MFRVVRRPEASWQLSPVDHDVQVSQCQHQLPSIQNSPSRTPAEKPFNENDLRSRERLEVAKCAPKAFCDQRKPPANVRTTVFGAKKSEAERESEFGIRHAMSIGRGNG